MNALLTTLLANPSYLSLGALVLSTFFAGSMLQGDRIRTQEIKEELREIKEMTAASLVEVEQIQVRLEQEDARLIKEIGLAYSVLAQLNEKERIARADLEASDRERQRLADQRRRQQNAVNQNGRLFFSN
ncbi:MAG: hypothetical protein AB8G77_11820 [Rhodothermales bacterium]